MVSFDYVDVEIFIDKSERTRLWYLLGNGQRGGEVELGGELCPIL